MSYYDHDDERPRSAMYYVLWVAMFAVGLFSWMFKGRRGGAIEGNELLPFSPLQILIPLLGALALAVFVMETRGHFPKLFEASPASWLFGVGILVICAGALVNIGEVQYRREALMYIVRWMMPFAFMIFLVLAQHHGVGWRPLAWGLCVGLFCSVVIVEAYRAGVTWLPVDRKTEGRFGGLFSHPNQYGIVTATTACVVVCLWKSGVGRLRFLAVVMLPLYLTALGQSMSKTNIIMFGVCLFLSAVVLSLHSAAKTVATIGISVAALAIALVAGYFGLELLFQLAPKDAQLIHEAIFDPGGVRSMDVREDVWDEAWGYVRANPWTGYGPGWASDNLSKNHAHNLFLQMEIDSGVIGTAGMAMVVVGCIWRALQLAGQAFHAPHRMGEGLTLRLVSGVAVLIYIAGNALSDSFGTATIPAFCIFSGYAFINDEWRLEHEGDSSGEELEEGYEDDPVRS